MAAKDAVAEEVAIRPERISEHRPARLGAAHRLPLADSIVYATADRVGGVVWTQDADFEGLPRVRYVPKRSGEPRSDVNSASS